MKDFFANPANLRKLEFWAATAIFVFAVLFLSANQDGPNHYHFDEVDISFNYYRNYFFPQLIKFTTLYLAFLLLNFVVAPKLIQKDNLFLHITLTLLTFLVIGAVVGVTDTYSKNYLFNQFDSVAETYDYIFQDSYLFAAWLVLIFGFYTVIKYVGIYILTNAEAIQSRYRLITQDSLMAFLLWMVSMLVLLIINAEAEFLLGWGILVPTGILLYSYACFKLIPESLGKKRAFWVYLSKVFVALILSFIPIALIIALITQRAETMMGITVFNASVHLVITAPLSWVLFKRQMRGKEELFVLKKELGHSNANLDFLRSQINPHFLFNALNTIYGTAIQEKAERTSEGIERLGEMMRFMLQENLQDKIALVREIEYLTNYICLQKLRIDANPGVQIQTEIEHPVTHFQIAPMLLIPFIENAFKHGISFREPSHIKITLEVRENTLYFDVYNSKHPKPQNDPEKDKSGIGLNNVKQRLQLLYPTKHELIIRETGKEFFVHLTLKLA
ncbi:sensor histidine kinase [Adhaeribacter rhizoryzae]|uniref:Sensor histidine kinase n=1 Tax=Adhaeribacter rhizoryzae TaxID=2607907 RepID=A0A5M6D4S7_9BACT|nr:histidine kinase [Adhaeribacter rhizoryzae]KAA5541302.1 sensor histidine kinase [Adhaeribacter rhizoryzae]